MRLRDASSKRCVYGCVEENVVAESMDDAPEATWRDAGNRQRWLADFVRSSRPVCAAIAPRPVLGTALAVGLLLVSEALVRTDELVSSLIGSRDAGPC